MQSFIQSFGGEGTIINLVSTGVALAVPGISSYASSKLAVIKMTQSLALGMDPHFFFMFFETTIMHRVSS